MKLRKSIITIAAAALAISVSAQQSEHDNYIGIHFGGGLNTMMYKTANGTQKVGAGFDAGLFYGHFFTPVVGLGVGVQYSWANAFANYNYSETTTGLTHSSNPNQIYNLTTTYANWGEKQNIGVISIPVEVLFRKGLSDRAAFIGGVGLSLDLPIYGTYSPQAGGTYTTKGVFPELGNYVVENLPEHGFDTYSTTRGGKIGNMAKVGASVIADLGFRVAMNDNWGIYFGVYAGYGFTNLISSAKTDPMVFIDDQNQIVYNGTFASSEISKANLLRAGAKIAIDFGWPAKVAEPEEQIPMINEDSLREAHEKAAREARFEQYKKEQQSVCGAMAEPDDSEECQALIAKAQQDIAALEYDPNLSEEENKARVDAIRDQLAKDLAAQREKDRLVREKAAEEVKEEHWYDLKGLVENINVYFENNGSEPNISEKDKAAIEELCRFMKENPELKVVVVGHTDSYGDPDRNLKYYGIKRAEVMRDYMVNKGVDPSQITCESKGQTEPVAPNDTRANRALNRRANIRLVNIERVKVQ